MNPTKNVKCVEVDSQLFSYLCEKRLDEIVEQIQAQYHELEERFNEGILKWEKIKDEDLYLETTEKVLLPDTRKLDITFLETFNSFDEALNYVKNCGKDKLDVLEMKAENSGMIVPSPFEKEIFGLEAQAIPRDLAKNLFWRDRTCSFMENGNFLTKSGKIQLLLVEDFSPFVYNIYSDIVAAVSSIKGALKMSYHQFSKDMTTLDICIQYELYPERINEKCIELMKKFHDIVKAGINIDDTNALKMYIKSQKPENLLGYDLRPEAIENDLEAMQFDLLGEDGTGKALREYLDNCDCIRGRIQKYDSTWYLTDEGKGHWELWPESEKEGTAKEEKKENEDSAKQSKHLLKLQNGVIARNPVADVRHNAVVGIDFGTKSTIVAVQDGDEQIIPLRVGMADYSIAPEAEHYENPTVMQFVDLSHFLECYQNRDGRPMTAWEDLKISHEAFKNMIAAKESTEFSAFVTDLKQWAAGRYGVNQQDSHLIIKDKKGYRFDLDDYLKLTEEDLDPIELYAYYIGLFINNMHTGIYLDYLLSFPETFSLEVREHIRKSFYKGIQKAIPSAVWEDEQCESEFRVRQGSSEPAAYAACALEQYHIEPTDEGVFYGIFDFGGGTTDYDYGIWKNAPEDEYTYNYVIKHYGSGGDKTLGGENILQLLAYYVFSDDEKHGQEDSNLELMRKNQLCYFRPAEAKIFSGTEALNNDGESAILNTKQMMEALRPLWEEWKEVQEWQSGEIQISENIRLVKNASVVKASVSLFSETERKPLEFVVDLDMVDQVIQERIEVGVRNFFEGLKNAYEKCENKEKQSIHLFLAGNSSKSKRLQETFLKYMEEYQVLLFGEEKEDDSESDIALEEEKEDLDTNIFSGYLKSFARILEKYSDVSSSMKFCLYPPLGTEEAREIQKSKGIPVDEQDLMAPTGKTGVAFGLIMCREGSMIKVESEKKKNEQIKLNYYIGVNYRKNFKLIFDRSTPYNTWQKFSKIAQDTETFEFYYTELPECVNGEIEIKGNSAIHKQKCMVDNVTEDASIYFKFLTPTQLEYVVALDDEIVSGEYLSKVYRVNL